MKNRNHEGYLDDTAYNALDKEERERKRITNLVMVLKFITHNAGFEFGERVVLVDRKTGRVWK